MALMLEYMQVKMERRAKVIGNIYLSLSESEARWGGGSGEREECVK